MINCTHLLQKSENDIGIERFLRTRMTFSQSLSVSNFGYTSFIFVDIGVRVSGAYYHNRLD